MTNIRRLLIIAGLIGFAGTSHAQMTPDEARAEGDALAESVRDGTNSSILSSSSPDTVPGYEGTSVPASSYADDAAGLEAAGEALRYSDPYNVVSDPYRTTFDPLTIDLSSPQAIEADPDTYLGVGFNLSGSDATCEPLPDTGSGTLTYFESCNQGSQPFDEPRTCPVPLNVSVDGSISYHHECWQTLGIPNDPNVNGWCPAFQSDALTAGASCSFVRLDYKGIICLQGTPNNCTEPEPVYAEVWSCDIPVPGWNSREVNTLSITSEGTDESICQTATSGATCTLDTEVCTAPNETRIINGLSVTRPCWEWERTYQCQGVSPANDCGELDARPECSFSHDECLSYEPDGTTCNVYDRWYQCTTDDGGVENPPAYVCSEDLYCIDGECTQVEREASDEFKDAMVAIQVMNELKSDFDPNNVRVFAGENLKCTKKLFGLSNCCTGKGVPLLTPWLCNAEDRAVDEKDDAGLCHNVGTYCSNKILGVCTTKKQSYCCFGSKLVRILQEQGRAQLGKTWGEPKEPDCEGFLIEEFQSLDLSVMDFSEVYAEFVDAAKIPSEIEMSLQIQEKIGDYYELHGGI